MTMALADFARVAINFARQRTLGQQTRPRAQSHRAAHLVHVHQIAQLENDRIRSLKIELRRISVFQIANIARKFNAGRLHAETNSKIRRACAARVRDCANNSFHTPLSESARHEDRIKVTQARFIVLAH